MFDQSNLSGPLFVAIFPFGSERFEVSCCSLYALAICKVDVKVVFITNVSLPSPSLFMVCGSMDKCAFIFLILTSDGTKVGDFLEMRERKVADYSLPLKFKNELI